MAGLKDPASRAGIAASLQRSVGNQSLRTALRSVTPTLPSSSSTGPIVQRAGGGEADLADGMVAPFQREDGTVLDAGTGPLFSAPPLNQSDTARPDRVGSDTAGSDPVGPAATAQLQPEALGTGLDPTTAQPAGALVELTPTEWTDLERAAIQRAAELATGESADARRWRLVLKHGPAVLAMVLAGIATMLVVRGVIALSVLAGSLLGVILAILLVVLAGAGILLASRTQEFHDDQGHWPAGDEWGTVAALGVADAASFGGVRVGEAVSGERLTGGKLTEEDAVLRFLEGLAALGTAVLGSYFNTGARVLGAGAGRGAAAGGRTAPTPVPAPIGATGQGGPTLERLGPVERYQGLAAANDNAGLPPQPRAKVIDLEPWIAAQQGGEQPLEQVANGGFRVDPIMAAKRSPKRPGRGTPPDKAANDPPAPSDKPANDRTPSRRRPAPQRRASAADPAKPQRSSRRAEPGQVDPDGLNLADYPAGMRPLLRLWAAEFRREGLDVVMQGDEVIVTVEGQPAGTLLNLVMEFCANLLRRRRPFTITELARASKRDPKVIQTTVAWLVGQRRIVELPNRQFEVVALPKTKTKPAPAAPPTGKPVLTAEQTRINDAVLAALKARGEQTDIRILQGEDGQPWVTLTKDFQAPLARLTAKVEQIRAYLGDRPVSADDLRLFKLEPDLRQPFVEYLVITGQAVRRADGQVVLAPLN